MSLFFQFGCSTSGTSQMSLKEQEVLDQALNSDMTPEEMILSSEEKLTEAREAELEFYSPKLYDAAVQSVKDAKRLSNLGAKPRKIAMKTIQAQKQLDSAYASKKVVEDLLSIGLSEKKLLDELEADTHFPEDYASVVALFKTINIKIGESRLEEAMGMQSQLIAATSALLVKTLEEIILKESKEVLASAKKNEARKYAPKTYVAAEVLMSRATTFIRTYPRDMAGIEDIGVRSLNASKHAYYVADQVKTLSGMDTEAIEGFVLDLEEELIITGKIIGNEGTVFMPLNEQVAGLKGAAEEISKKAGRVEGLEETARNLEAEVSALKTEAEVVGEKAGRVDGLMADKESNNQVIVELRKDNEAIKTELEEARQTLLLKNMELEKFMATKGPMDEELKNYVTRISELELEAKQAEEAMAETLTSVEKKNATLENDLTALEVDRDKNHGEVARLRDKVQKLNARLESQSRARSAVDASVSGKL